MTNARPVALITMATGYVGPALARSLAARGYDLVLHGSAGDDTMVGVEVAFADQVPALEALGAKVHTVTDVDLATAEGNRSLAAAALDRFGRIDSACLVTGLIVVGKFLDMTTDQWERVKRMNLDMVFHGLQAVLPPMVDARQGQVVVFTSATGARPDPITSIYGGTRAGANGIVRAVGLEYARQRGGHQLHGFPRLLEGVTGRRRSRAASRYRSAGADAQARNDGRTRRVHVGVARRHEPVPDRSVLQLQRWLEYMRRSTSMWAVAPHTVSSSSSKKCSGRSIGGLPHRSVL